MKPPTYADFDASFDFLMFLEGGNKLANIEGDPGGRTRYGLSERSFPEAWVNGPPDEALARKTYREVYWGPLQLGCLLCQGIADEIFEMAVHTTRPPGVNVAVMAAQRAANQCFELYGMRLLTEDGLIGHKTVTGLNQFYYWGGLARLAFDGAFNIEQLKYYRTLNQKLQDKFIKAWTRRIVN